MSFNLLDSVKGLFTDNLISTAASSLNESEGGIQKALSGAIPAILAGLVGKADNHEGAASILEMAKQSAGSGLLSNISGFLGNGNNNLLSKGAEMLKGVLGDKAGGIASLVSNFAGIKHSSSSSILSMVAPVALGALGNHAAENNLSAGGLMSFLSSQKNSIMSALPASLGSITGLLGIGAASSAVTGEAHKVTASAHHAVHEAESETGNGMKFLLPLLLAIFAVAIGIYLFKGCGSSTHEAAPMVDTAVAKAAEEPAKPVTTARELFKVKLPDGVILDAYKGGIEDQLVTFLGTDYKKLGEDSLKKIWFNFDDLNFETGNAVITAESQKQVNNIAAILKAFPASKLKIGGYTDKTGDEATNKKLSDARAKSVQAALTKAGVEKQIIGAEGYGSEQAIYAADAPDSDRIKDRHVSVSVRL